MFNINDRFNFQRQRKNNYSNCVRCKSYYDKYHNAYFDSLNKEYINKYNSYYDDQGSIYRRYRNQCSDEEFEKLFFQYKELDTISNNAINEILRKLQDVAECINLSIAKVDESNNAYVKMEQWFEKCLEEFNTKYSVAETKELKEQIYILMSEIRELIFDSMKFTKTAEEKLSGSLKLDEYMKKLQDEYAKISHLRENRRYY